MIAGDVFDVVVDIRKFFVCCLTPTKAKKLLIFY